MDIENMIDCMLKNRLSVAQYGWHKYYKDGDKQTWVEYICNLLIADMYENIELESEDYYEY